jgi:hypothetical protein
MILREERARPASFAEDQEPVRLAAGLEVDESRAVSLDRGASASPQGRLEDDRSVRGALPMFSTAVDDLTSAKVGLDGGQGDRITIHGVSIAPGLFSHATPAVGAP